MYNDPSGHCIDGISTIVCIAVAGALVGGIVDAAVQYHNTGSVDWAEVGSAALAGSAIAVTAAVAVPAALMGAGMLSGSASVFAAGTATAEALGTASMFGLGAVAAEEASENGLELSVLDSDPSLQKQIQIVNDSMDSTGAAPSGVAQGGNPAGLFQNRPLPNGGSVVPQNPNPDYWTESDVWPSQGIGTGTRAVDRLLFGEGGEVYYSPDHYNSPAIRLKGPD